MLLKVNGEHVDITLEGEKTVGEVLQSFEREAAKNEATTTKITLNGKEVPASEFGSILDVPLEDSTELDLSVLSKLALTDNLRYHAERFEDLDDQLGDISILLQSGRDGEAGRLISSLADAISGFCHTVAMCALFPELYTRISIGGRNVNEFFEEFIPILRDFEAALQSKDTVTVGDLAEYEIRPRLESLSAALHGIIQ